jgi:hypothetical protein
MPVFKQQTSVSPPDITSARLPFSPKGFDFSEFAAFLRRSDPAFAFQVTSSALEVDDLARRLGCPKHPSSG